jgi:hypothetical protein
LEGFSEKELRWSSIWDMSIIEKGTWTLTVPSAPFCHFSEREHVLGLGLDFRVGEMGEGAEGVNQEEGGEVKKRGSREGLEKGKEGIRLLGWDLRGRRQKGVGTLKRGVGLRVERFS